jgi:hypothetical protein
MRQISIGWQHLLMKDRIDSLVTISQKIVLSFNQSWLFLSDISSDQKMDVIIQAGRGGV